MEQHHLIVEKTARYFSLGKPSEKVKHLWIVAHGYGQLANYFLRNFSPLEAEDTIVVAPEGLHRFYWEKFSGRVVASWMTKEDRLSDIHDNAKYLDRLYDELVKGLDAEKLKIHILGFSQGTATICRWLCASSKRVDDLVVWAGTMPNDIEPDVLRSRISAMRIVYVYGTKDEFLGEAEITAQRNFFQDHGLHPTWLSFEGEHKIESNCLQQLDRILR